MAATVFEFGEFRLDSRRFELCRAGRTLKLERKPMELLILLAASEGNLVTRAEIAERLWGSEVFVDTEHGINTAVRKIRQVLRDDSEEPRFIQTVTAKGYRFIGPIAEKPTIESRSTQIPATLSDVPPPAYLEPPGGSKNATSRSPRLWLWLGTSAALALLIIVGLRARGWGSRASAAKPEIKSLAVLPLDNLSGDRGQDYFADGMTDELTTMLAKNSTLHVVSRTSAMQYKGAHRPLRDIASALGVDGIVEGSVERNDGKVHMTIQLIHAPSDTHIWADSYDRDTNDVVTLPTEAAEAIAKRLNSTAPTLKPARYVNPEAHDAYLRGKFLWYTSADGGGSYFKKAVELQQDYAPGWSGLAIYYGSGAGYPLNPKEVLGPMEAASRKAVALDDSLPEAHLALAAALMWNRWDLAGADHELLRAIELDPQYAEALHLRSEFLAALNRHQESIEIQKRATELDPFSRPRALAYSYQLARQYDAAITDLTQRLQSKPDDPGLLRTLAEVYRCKGMKKEATQALERFLTVTGDKTSAEAIKRAYSEGGYDTVLHWRIADLKGKSAKQYVSPVILAGLYAELGQKEKTLSLLAAGADEHNPAILWIQCDPAFDFLHKDERYRSIIRHIGLPPAY
ncbi:MAG TPA: winged helix-turn-helix domain-containing protein [Acidobacteriaceae bacterium]